MRGSFFFADAEAAQASHIVWAMVWGVILRPLSLSFRLTRAGAQPSRPASMKCM
jgi:hypothetical protein